MAGEANARGWGVILGTDLVKNLPAALTGFLDTIARATPYQGQYNGVISTTAGNTTINHGLSFTPSKIFVQSIKTTPATDPILALGVDSITATTFRVRFATFVLSSGNNYFTALGGMVVTQVAQIDWMAFR